jgi:hypothetical protein
MQTDPNSTINDQRQLQVTIRRLLDEAKDAAGERRADSREPFFSPVTLTFPAEGQRQFSCFSRDISPSGIGLLHYMPVKPAAVVVTMPSKSRGNVRIRSQIMWCRPCGEGWYVSGARFLEVMPPAEAVPPTA